MNYTEEYYNSFDPQERRRILLEKIDLETQSAADAVRLQLWDDRYRTRPGMPDSIDYFMRGWTLLQIAGAASNGWNGKGRVFSDARESLHFLCLDRAGSLEYEDNGTDIPIPALSEFQSILCAEFDHLTRYYITLCRENKRYNNKFLRFGHISPAVFESKLSHDIYTVAFLVPRKLKAENDFSLFTMAVTDSYSKFFGTASIDRLKQMDKAGQLPSRF